MPPLRQAAIPLAAMRDDDVVEKVAFRKESTARKVERTNENDVNNW
jgi:hypothetical protein